MKYLIYCGPGIGDLILILPMARMIKKNDPDAQISLLLTSDKNRIKITKALFSLQSDIHDLNYYSVREPGHFASVMWKLGYRMYDYGFVLQYTDNENTSEWPYRIVSFAAKKVCGIKLHCKPNVKYDYEIARIPNYRIVDYPILMLKAIGFDTTFDVKSEELLDTERIEMHASEIPELSTLTETLISIVMGTAAVGGKINGQPISNSAKNWPYEYWIALAEKLVNAGYTVAFLGGNKEKQELEAYNLNGINGVVNLVGKCSITQSVGVLCKSKLVIGADTGLMHCAGALNIPSLTLYGCTDYHEYLPFGKWSYYIQSEKACSPCFGSDKALLCQNHLCMKEISPDTVLQKAIKIINDTE